VDPLLDQVARVLREEGVGAGASVAVACSGGPDSAALAHAAMALARAGELGSVTLIYVDHGLRDASADIATVEALAAAGGGQASIVAVEVARDSGSLEAAARDARYAALAEQASAFDVAVVLLAHTASDQAETVLHRVIRGTGVRGLSAIPRRRGIYLRPLLDLPRSSIESYLGRTGIEAADDEMNRDRRFTRVRIREHWLPALREENPQIDDALCRLASSAADYREVLEFAVAAATPRAKDGIGLDAGALADLPEAVAIRLLADAAEAAGLEPLEARHLEATLEICRRDESGTMSLDLPGGQMIREYQLVRFAHGPVREPAAQPELLVEGSRGPYQVRVWQQGDRMRPQRLKGRSRKLSDLFIDGKVPRVARERARVVIRQSDGEIVWAEHIGEAHGSVVDVAYDLKAP
jgi:tRNA(Ile)-lysidine synthase